MIRRALTLVVPMLLPLPFLSTNTVEANEIHIQPSASNCLPNSVAQASPSRNQACHALHDAVRADNVVLVKLQLSEGADVNDLDLFGTPLHVAASRNLVDIAKVLIDAGANLEAEAVVSQKRDHPLHTAAFANAVKVAELLISRGAQVDVRNTEGATPLSVAAMNGQAEVAELLLKAGADPLAEESHYYAAPLELAAANGRLNVVQLLFSLGVDINRRNKHDGSTPLWWATDQDRVDVVAFLLAHGADPNIPNNGGRTPLRVATPSTRDLLLKYGAKQ